MALGAGDHTGVVVSSCWLLMLACTLIVACRARLGGYARETQGSGSGSRICWMALEQASMKARWRSVSAVT